MKKVIYFSVISLLIACSACKPKEQNQPDSQNVVIGDNSENSMDWSGVYTGIIPCADCMGIQTQIILNGDYTYTLAMLYLGKSETPETYSGTFQWDASGSIVTLSNMGRDIQPRYKVGENVLFQLDLEGNCITGALKQNYVLSKVDEELTNKQWMLAEFFDKAVSYKAKDAIKAFIVFQSDGNQLNGNGGCNNFTGYYRLGTGNAIFLSDMVSTRKMCAQNMEIENKLNQLFPLINSYSIEGNMLILSQDNKPLAKFVTE